MKVYVRAPYEEACLAELNELFDEVVYEPWTTSGQRYYEDEMLEHLLAVQPDALITELDRVTEKVLAGYDRLKFIGDCRGTPANLQVDACTKAGVPILCTPGRNTQAVAEMVVGLILTMYRKTIPAIQWVQDGKWVQGTTPYYLWMGHELQGKKVGFVGFGAISHAVAKILDGFECDISFYDPFLPGDQGHYRKKSLEEIFSDLEQTIKEMEDGEISLEESFRLYHQGMDMLKACNSKIDKVEKKMLLLDEEGEEHEF